jgi:hypothetical protein
VAVGKFHVIRLLRVIKTQLQGFVRCDEELQRLASWGYVTIYVTVMDLRRLAAAPREIKINLCSFTLDY